MAEFNVNATRFDPAEVEDVGDDLEQMLLVLADAREVAQLVLVDRPPYAHGDAVNLSLSGERRCLP